MGYGVWSKYEYIPIVWMFKTSSTNKCISNEYSEIQGPHLFDGMYYPFEMSDVQYLLLISYFCATLAALVSRKQLSSDLYIIWLLALGMKCCKISPCIKYIIAVDCGIDSSFFFRRTANK